MLRDAPSARIDDAPIMEITPQAVKSLASGARNWAEMGQFAGSRVCHCFAEAVPSMFAVKRHCFCEAVAHQWEMKQWHTSGNHCPKSLPFARNLRQGFPCGGTDLRGLVG